MTSTSLSTFNIISSIILLYIRQTISCPQDYVYCTTEGGICAATGNVAYGIQNSWVYKTSTGSIQCDNDIFTDPANGLTKMCCIQNPNVITPNLVIQNPQRSNTIIDGIWQDDFNYDPTQINGWNIYNNIQGALNNPIVTGALNRKYHGTFSRISDGRQNYMKRQFKCLSKSNVYISYKFAYCKTESADTMKMVWIGTTYVEKEHGMDSSSNTDIRLDIFEGKTFESNLGSISRCNNANEWNYQSVIEHYVGIANADQTWELIFAQIFSGETEYGLLFDISINCDARPVFPEPGQVINPPEIIPVPVPQLPVPGPAQVPPNNVAAPGPAPQPVPGPEPPTNNNGGTGSNNNSINNSNNNSNNEEVVPGGFPPPSGIEIGAYGQWCAVPAFNMKHQCEFNTDVIREMNNIECTNPYECCMCEFIECNECDLMRIGDYSAFGVSDITVYGNHISGAVIECLGIQSCKDTGIIGTDINMILCKGEKSCQNALVTVDVVDFALECTEFESCSGLQMEITVSGSPPPSGFACPSNSPEILFSRLLCAGDRSCENLHITINNKGCSTVIIEDILCSTTNSCNNCIISGNGNDIPCNSIEYITIEAESTVTSNNVNNPININPVTSAPQPDINAKFCCHSSMPAFELWNGYCLMVTNGNQCNGVANSRCIWKENDCFPNPQCVMREGVCSPEIECCSKVCLYQNPMNPLDGVCR